LSARAGDSGDGSPSRFTEDWPTWLASRVVVAVGTTPLLLAPALGWRRDAFRRAWW